MMDEEIIPYDLFSKMVDDTIARARNGDTESARKILKWFCGAIKTNTDKDGKPHVKPSGKGTQIDERILRYLGECFQKILDDASGPRVDANHALWLVTPGKRGVKKTRASRQKQIDIALEVWECHERNKEERKSSEQQLLRGEKSPLECAFGEVAKKREISCQTVKDAWDTLDKNSGLAEK